MTKSKSHNGPAERAALGAFLKDVLLFHQFKDRVVPALFFNGSHQRIVKIMHGLADAGREFSVSAIAGRVPDDQAHGMSAEGYLSVLISEATDPADLHEAVADLEELCAARQMADLGQALVSGAFEDNGLSARERLDKARASIDLIGDRMTTQAAHVHDVSERMMARIVDAYQAEKTVGMRSGLKALDDLIGPAMPGQVIVLASPPGGGKTSLAWKMARKFADEMPGCFFSQEMEPEELTARDLSQQTGIPSHKIESATLDADEIERLGDASRLLKGSMLYVDGEPGLNHMQIRNRAYRLRRTHGCGFIFIDHLLYCGRTEKRQTTLDAIGENMKGFKHLAKKMKIPVFVLAQLTKEFAAGKWQDIRRPLVSDIYGGAQVEHDSDVIAFIHRPSVMLERKKPQDGAKDMGDWEAERLKWEGLAEISLGKRRGGAGYGHRTCFFDGPTMMFSDMKQAQRKPHDAVLEEAARLPL